MICDRCREAEENAAAMVKIATLAIEADKLERLVRIERADLSTAYSDHKSRTGHAAIKRGSSEWDEMLEATKAEYGAVEEAKRKASNAKRRLKTAIERHHSAA